MSRSSVSYWPSLAANTNTVALIQGFAANVPLILNANTGGYSNPPQSFIINPFVPTTPPTNPLAVNTQANLTSVGYAPANGPYYMPGIIRKISLLSTSNLQTVTFKITGMGFAASNLGAGSFLPPVTLITEELIGPNIGTVHSANIWSRIDSIVPLNNEPVAGNKVTVGYGNDGMTNFQMLDYDRIAWYGTAQTQIAGTGGSNITYSLFASLTSPFITDPKSGNLNYPTDGVLQFALPNFTSPSTGNQLQPLASPYVCIWARVQDGANCVKSFYLTTLQQGVRA